VQSGAALFTPKNNRELINANNIVTKAKSIVSPFFGAKDFAFAYAA